jgi:hypothetical protein
MSTKLTKAEIEKAIEQETKDKLKALKEDKIIKK